MNHPNQPSPSETIRVLKKQKKRGPKPGHGGRPRKVLRPDEVAGNLAALGLTMAEIAECMGISERTLRQWRVDNKKLSAALKRGREMLTLRIEDSLASRALGMTIPETKVLVVNGEIVLTTIEKHIPPDVLAIIFYLKNRAPERWGDRQDVRVQQTIAGLPEAVTERIRALAKAKHSPKPIVDVQAQEVKALLPAKERYWNYDGF